MNDYKLDDLLSQLLSHLGGALRIAFVRMRRSLGLYKMIQKYGSLSSSELAQAADLSECYVRECLSFYAVSNYASCNFVTE